MSASRSVRIDALVHELERPALRAGAYQLVECLNAASDSSWQVQLRFPPSLAAGDVTAAPEVSIASLLGEVLRDDEPLAVAELRWRRDLAGRSPSSAGTLLLCTVFRGTAERASDADGSTRPATVERIRQLNRLAIDLSHDFGIGLIDIDRVLTFIGARRLRTDFRLGSAAAAEAAGFAIAQSLLAFGLDRSLPPEVAERAAALHGSLFEIEQRLVRRVKRAR